MWTLFLFTEESRQRILQTGVLAAVERFKEKGPCSDLALDFTCRWLLQVLGEEGGDSSDGKVRMEVFYFGCVSSYGDGHFHPPSVCFSPAGIWLQLFPVAALPDG